MPHTAQELLNLFENYRAEHPFNSSPGELYEPVNYILGLGGKRIRPLLTLMACDLFSGNIQEALPAAYAMELFHNFTLAHDDIMDNAGLRRGNPTVHQKFNTAQAILSGDVMLIYVYDFLCRIEKDKVVKVFELFNDSAIRVCEGQQYDMNFQTAANVSVPEYLKMIEFKTAVLLACSLKTGAIIAGADDKDANLIYDFGKNIGICFQLLDDLLDAFGDESKFGKKIGGDIAQNKKTFLYINAIEMAKGVEKEKLSFYFSNNVPVEEKVSNVLEIYRKMGVEQAARLEAEKYHSAAYENLDSIDLTAERKLGLKELAESLFIRKA